MGQEERILIVEDEPAIAETVEYSLQREGFSVMIATTLAGATESRKNHNSISLMILDIGLPDGNGLEYLKTLQKEETSFPVILLTARYEEMDRVLGLELGADDYVVKPFSPRELVARVKAVLRRYRGDQKSSGAVHNVDIAEAEITEASSCWKVDEERGLIFFHGKQLSLSHYEFGTLSLLLKHPGWVFSREKIMDAVWTQPEDSFDRSVDTVIKNLRMQLRQVDPHDDSIFTRRGMGYGIKETQPE